MTIARHPDWSARKMRDEMILMNARTGRFLGLNAVGARIWALLETPRDLEGLLAELSAHYQLDETQARIDVERFLEEMARDGMIELAA